jgi:hypothetical protein
MQKTTDQKAPEVKIRKTGKSENVLGYKCDQYEITSKDSKTLVWITTELGVGYSNLMSSLSMMMKTGGGLSLPDTKGMTNGVMLKMEGTDLSNNKTIQLVAKSVNKDGMLIKTAGYKGMVMPGQ